MGLVNRVMADNALDGFVEKLARNIAANAPLTIAASKLAFEALISPAGDFAPAHAALSACMNSDDYIEGRRAFMEKRMPRFKGK